MAAVAWRRGLYYMAPYARAAARRWRRAAWYGYGTHILAICLCGISDPPRASNHPSNAYKLKLHGHLWAARSPPYIRGARNQPHIAMQGVGPWARGYTVREPTHL